MSENIVEELRKHGERIEEITASMVGRKGERYAYVVSLQVEAQKMNKLTTALGGLVSQTAPDHPLLAMLAAVRKDMRMKSLQIAILAAYPGKTPDTLTQDEIDSFATDVKILRDLEDHLISKVTAEINKP